jgi:sugar transferase (PEP-CTERM/EpsH1 system associated)
MILEQLMNKIDEKHTFKKLTILHLVISLETGGLERFVIDLIAANMNMCNQFIVCLEQAGELANNCKSEVIWLNMPQGIHLGVVWKIAEISRNHCVDIIHTHNEKAQLYGGIAGLLTRVPVVHTKHGKNDTNWRSMLRNNISARLCRKVVAVSRDAAQECIRDEKIPSSKVLTFLNGVDVERFSPGNNREESKRRLGLDEDTLVIGIVARLALVKDHATLFEACRILFESGEEFRLLVVGDGSLRSQLERLTHSLGISKQVIFAGMRDDIPNVMRGMDIFVLSSLSEGISLTLLEAMACCLPVVATAVGGNPEVVIGGETGLLVPPQQPDLLAENLSILIADLQLRQQMGKAGRQRVVNHFSISETAEEYRQLYITLAR